MSEAEVLSSDDGLDARRVVVLPKWTLHFRDPAVRSVLVLVLLAAGGFAMFALGWRGSARTVYVPLQLPWLISGGLTGFALLGLALGAWSIHLSRRENAAHREAFEDFVHDAAELAEKIRRREQPAPARKAARKTTRKKP
ncbi:MAG TPA: hypothetical protein VHC43_02380 [Mycobacteriales bacterium]|nr:hypothetical protein [Mycobacteriales bacterium]